MSRHEFFKTLTTKLRLEIEEPTTGLQNLVKNPSGEKGAWGWETPAPLSTMGADTEGLQYSSLAGASWFTTELMLIGGGRYAFSQLTLLSLTSGHQIRLRYEWYDAAKNYLSSSAQSSAQSAVNTPLYGPIAQSPGNAAYLRLRVDVTVGGADPTGTHMVEFQRVMVTHWATADPTQTRINLVANPSFELGTDRWDALGPGWSRSTAVQAVGESYSLARKANFRSEGQLRSHSIPVTGGRTYTLSTHFLGPATSSMRLGISWYYEDAAPTDALAVQVGGEGASWKRASTTATAPSNATHAQIVVFITQDGSTTTYVDGFLLEDSRDVGSYFDGATTDAAGVDYSWSGAAHDSSSLATLSSAAFIYKPPIEWRDILGPTHEIKVKREGFNVGSIDAVIYDAWLDPATADTIQAGRKVRLRSKIFDQWHSVFEGSVDKAKTTYQKAKGSTLEAHGAVRIDLTATDPFTTLSNAPEYRSVSSVNALPFLLEGKGVPWVVNGSGSHVGQQVVTGTNNNASVADQIAITRDTNLAYAWVDRAGVLQAWDSSLFGTAEVLFHFSDQPDSVLSYTDIDVTHDIKDCINTVKINFLRYKPVAGETEEIAYGPYVDAQSVLDRGPQEATFAITGVEESPAAIAQYAATILAANAVPQVRANSLTMSVRSDQELVAATWIDLYTSVGVEYEDRVDDDLRVVSIEHTISSGKWMTNYTFSRTDSIVAPTWTPSPDSGNKSLVSRVLGQPLSRFQAALAMRTTRPARVVTLGSSTTAGSVATTRENQWSSIFLRSLQSSYPSGVPGWEFAPKTFSEQTSVERLPGVQLLNGGVAGTTSANYCNLTTMSQIAVHDPSMIIHMIGSNDSVPGELYVSPSDFRDNIVETINEIDLQQNEWPPCHVLVHTYRRWQTSKVEWNVYGDQLRQIAETRDNVLFLDLSDQFESLDLYGANVYGVMSPDAVHMADPGHALMADMITRGINLSQAPTEDVRLILSDSFITPNTPIQGDPAPRADKPPVEWNNYGNLSWMRGNGALMLFSLGESGDTLVQSGVSNMSISSIMRTMTGSMTGMVFRALSPDDRLGVFLDQTYQAVSLFKTDGGVSTSLATVSHSLGNEQSHFVRVVAENASVKVYLAGALVLDHTLDSTDQAKYSGAGYTKVGFRVTNAGFGAWFRGLTVRSL